MNAKHSKGSKGGCAVRDKYGVEYLRTIASNGGNKTVETYGTGYMSLIGSTGAIQRIVRHILPTYDALGIDCTPFAGNEEG